MKASFLRLTPRIRALIIAVGAIGLAYGYAIGSLVWE